MAADPHETSTAASTTSALRPGTSDEKPQPSHQTPRFEELDALRGCCIIPIVLGHFWFAFGDDKIIPGLISGSIMCVDLLFVLSGFCIAYGYLLDGKPKSLIGAAFRRFPRLILPIIVANVLSRIFLALGAFDAYTAWSKLSPMGSWCQMCFGLGLPPEDRGGQRFKDPTQAFFFGKDHFFSFVDGAWVFPWQWTVPNEVFGSTIVFMIAPFFRWIVNLGIYGPGTLQLRRCLIVHSVCLLSLYAGILGFDIWARSYYTAIDKKDSQIFHLFDILPGGHLHWYRFDNVVNNYIMVGLWLKVRTAFLFVLGMALAQVSIALRPHSRASGYGKMQTKPCDSWARKWFLPFCLILLPVGFPTLAELLDAAVSFRPPHWGFIRPLLLTFGPVSILAGVLCSPQEFRTAFAQTPFSYLGRVCYSLYLTHMMIIFSLGTALYVWLQRSLGPIATLSLIVVLCAGPLLLVTHLFWLFAEEPFGLRLPRQTFSFIWQSAEKKHPLVTQWATENMHPLVARWIQSK